MPAANDIRKGQVIKHNGEPHLVMETQHRTPGNLRAFVQVKMRNLRYGKALDQRFASTDTIEVLPTDRRTLEFSYADRGTYAFIDPSTFDQIDLSEQILGDLKHYLTAGGKVDVLFVDDKPLTVELPVLEAASRLKMAWLPAFWVSAKKPLPLLATTPNTVSVVWVGVVGKISSLLPL